MQIGIHAIGFLFWFLKINQVSESGTPRWLGGGLGWWVSMQLAAPGRGEH